MSTRKTKPYEQLDFTDDFMFSKIMRTEPEICKKIIEICIGKKVSKISYPETQKTISITADAKGVRFDVYVEDEEDTVYDIEMQIANTKNLSKRPRYYQGMIDLNTLERGGNYKDLKNTYIIFLCLFDPFEKYITQYTFEQMCHEVNGLTLGNDAKIIFINPFGRKDNKTDEEKAFFSYLQGTILDLPFAKLIDDSVKKARLHEEWKVEYMTLLLRDQDNYDKGYEAGTTEGIQKGEMSAKMEILRNLLSTTSFPMERLMEITKLPKEVIEEEMRKDR